MDRRVFMLMLAVAAVLGPLGGQSAHAEPGGAQVEVRKEMRAGNVRSLREIERQVLPAMRGMQYLGPEYDPLAVAYRLKFINNGRVVFVDVDARSGRVINTSK